MPQAELFLDSVIQDQLATVTNQTSRLEGTLQKNPYYSTQGRITSLKQENEI